MPLSPGEFDALIRREIQANQALVKAANLKFKPKPRFEGGYFVPGEATEGVRAGQLFPQPAVEFADGKRVLIDEVLGPGFACIMKAGDESTRRALSDLTECAPRVIRFQSVEATSGSNGETHHETVRDCEGVIARTLREAGAVAVILRPDRYVLAYLGANDPVGDVAKINRLMRCH
jgi:3-(3-hydroxy-phenyl)propionate hydroxylase